MRQTGHYVWCRNMVHKEIQCHWGLDIRYGANLSGVMVSVHIRVGTIRGGEYLS